MCTVLLPSGVIPIAVNKYININHVTGFARGESRVHFQQGADILPCKCVQADSGSHPAYLVGTGEGGFVFLGPNGSGV
jgi:hypothetical protein